MKRRSFLRSALAAAFTPLFAAKALPVAPVLPEIVAPKFVPTDPFAPVFRTITLQVHTLIVEARVTVNELVGVPFTVETRQIPRAGSRKARRRRAV